MFYNNLDSLTEVSYKLMLECHIFTTRIHQSRNYSCEAWSEYEPRGARAPVVTETVMNAPRFSLTGTICLFAVLYASNALSQSDDSGEFAAGTRYELIATDEVSFGPGIQNEARKELLFKLSAKSDKSSADAEDSVLADNDSVVWSGSLAFDRIDFLQPGEVRLHEVSDGFSYSASIDVESKEDFRSQSEFVSSRQLGIHYGRLGSENYSAVDLGVTNFKTDVQDRDDALSDDKELWSLGVTTGRRFALTGLDSNDPLWTVALRGQFNIAESDTIDDALDTQQWYLSPGLQWRSNSFRLTADVLMPFIQSGELEDDSDYRIRAKIQKKF